jgi:hypothetical protein
VFIDQIEHKEKVIAFVERHRHSSRRTLQQAAAKFLKRYDNS